MKYYIWSPGFNSLSGGCMVLHRLCHMMTELSQDVYLVCDRMNPDWLGKTCSVEEVDRNGVAIYPEIISGNPFHCHKVVRWILMTPGFFGGDGKYLPADYVYKYTNQYSIPDESLNRGLLTVMNSNTDLFVDRGTPRSGTCHLVRKGSSKPQNEHSSDSLCIDDYHLRGGDQFLVDTFNSRETFISYDHATYISIQAALCGAISIIIPDPHMSITEWKEKDLFHGYGRSYGLHDIPWAIETRELLRQEVHKTIELSINQVKQLIQDTCT